MSCEHHGCNDGGGIPYVDRGEPLPQSYGENRIIALSRSPESVFVYWDVETEVRASSAPLVLCTHVVSSGEKQFQDLDAQTDNMYFQVASNRVYRFELYVRPPEGDLRLLVQSDEIATPVQGAGESGAEPPAEAVLAQRQPIARRGVTREELRRAREAAAAPAPVPAPVPMPKPPPGPFYTSTSR
jgi:hypothetical protein